MTAPAAPAAASATSAAARIAAISGIVFAVLFVVALVLVRRAPTLGDPDAAYTAFYANGGDQLFVAVGLYLVPFAGIAFLWHMTAMRNVLDMLTPPPSTMAHGLNLLAGVIFVTLLFAGTAAVGAVAFGIYFGHAPVEDPATARALTARRLRPGVRLRGPRGGHVRDHHHDPAARRRACCRGSRPSSPTCAPLSCCSP